MEPHIRESIEDLVTCLICREIFKNPRQLPCSHTYCRACIIEHDSVYRYRFLCPRRDDCVVNSDKILSQNLTELHIDGNRISDQVAQVVLESVTRK